MSQPATILELSGIVKTFTEPTGPLHLLAGLSLQVRPGEIVLLQGVSGSGKTTLLQISGAMMRADAGRVLVAGFEINQASEPDRTAARRCHLAPVYELFQACFGVS
jgi:ABC-type lipoprotein export system ATPase subunit